MMVYPKKIQQERLVERTAPWENESHHLHQSAAISGDSQALNWCYLNRNNDTSLKKLMFPGKRAILIRTKKVIETVPLLQCNLFTAFIGCPGVDELLESVRSLWQSDMENGNDSILCIGGIPTPLKNMKVSWGDYSQYMEKPIGNPIYIYSILWIGKAHGKPIHSIFRNLISICGSWIPWLSNIPEANPNCSWLTPKCVSLKSEASPSPVLRKHFFGLIPPGDGSLGQSRGLGGAKKYQ
jgi:hypothetical protein